MKCKSKCMLTSWRIWNSALRKTMCVPAAALGDKLPFAVFDQNGKYYEKTYFLETPRLLLWLVHLRGC